MDEKPLQMDANKVMLPCIQDKETRLVMEETHKEAQGNHSGV